ncbi:MAG: phosphoenolpyruvate synthase [Myxococcales bacterium]|nr:phosphoenolpyruvate synthase [Myxococcales bacterium]USN51842.1 MAG: phosphoenolpyruvate synthase [Myxococcales bacterium]
MEQVIKWFDQLSNNDIALVGGKNASLGEMISQPKSASIPVPFGFALTTDAYLKFLEKNNIGKIIYEKLDELDPSNLKELAECSLEIKTLIKKYDFDEETVAFIKAAYKKLLNGKENMRVAVRSSASAEDLPHASFAGQQDTYLHVASFAELIKRIKDVYASLFGERAIAYRAHQNFDHRSAHISVGVQRMVNSDEGVSGVMFSIDPESGFRDGVFINASYGLGESVVSGAVNPDEFMIYKPAIKNNSLVVLNRKLGSKASKLVFDGEHSLKKIDVEQNLSNKFCLNHEDLKKLASMAVIIEDHYQRPMDIEWAKDGVSGELFILQARPETVHSNQSTAVQQSYFLKSSGPIIAEGRAVGKRIGQGKARVLKTIGDAKDFMIGEVLVTDMTDPNWEPVMQKASAIVTDRGGRTCHAAIIARELGIAAVVGCDSATKTIKNESDVTVSCAEGDTGYVYQGLLEIGQKNTQLSSNIHPPVPLMLIAANPQKALSYHSLPHHGIGLARLEFIIATMIGIHPNALIQYKNMPLEIKNTIDVRTRDFATPKDFYVATLAQGITSLAAVAFPYPAIVRLSDFKTNEYEELLGGNLFEAKENNPMLGFRGAARYLSEQFSHAFELECEAIKQSRAQGFKNIQVMVPFVRTINEARSIIEVLAKNGISSGPDLKIIMMCEVPSNVVMADEFLQFFDGFSIGSNDLTQLCLGVDRDSHILANSFCESDPAMLRMLSKAIDACKKVNKYVGICGQGPSDNIDFARWLIQQGIDTISLNPDTIADVHQALSDL